MWFKPPPVAETKERRENKMKKNSKIVVIANEGKKGENKMI